MLGLCLNLARWLRFQRPQRRGEYIYSKGGESNSHHAPANFKFALSLKTWSPPYTIFPFIILPTTTQLYYLRHNIGRVRRGDDRGVMSLKIYMYSTKREKIKLIQRARTKVRYKKAFPMQEIKGNVSDYETDYKDLGKRPIPSKINTKGKRSVHNDWWWKIPTPAGLTQNERFKRARQMCTS